MDFFCPFSVSNSKSDSKDNSNCNVRGQLQQRRKSDENAVTSRATATTIEEDNNKSSKMQRQQQQQQRLDIVQRLPQQQQQQQLLAPIKPSVRVSSAPSLLALSKSDGRENV
jgi:hypothetical protein